MSTRQFKSKAKKINCVFLVTIILGMINIDGIACAQDESSKRIKICATVGDGMYNPHQGGLFFPAQKDKGKWRNIDIGYKISKDTILDIGIGYMSGEYGGGEFYPEYVNKISTFPITFSILNISSSERKKKWCWYGGPGIGYYYIVKAEYTKRIVGGEEKILLEDNKGKGIGWHFLIGTEYFFSPKVSLNIVGLYRHFEADVIRTDTNKIPITLSGIGVNIGLGYYF